MVGCLQAFGHKVIKTAAEMVVFHKKLMFSFNLCKQFILVCQNEQMTVLKIQSFYI